MLRGRMNEVDPQEQESIFKSSDQYMNGTAEGTRGYYSHKKRSDLFSSSVRKQTYVPGKNEMANWPPMLEAKGRNFLHGSKPHGGFMLHQLLNSEVCEGSSTSSIVPDMWPFAGNNNANLAEADHRFFHPTGSVFNNSYHFSPHYDFSSHREAGMAPPPPSHENYYVAESDNVRQPNNNNGVPSASEFYMMDVDALPVPSFMNAIPVEGRFIEGLELGQGKSDNIISTPNAQFNLKRKVQVSSFQSGELDITSEIPKKKTRTMKNASGNNISKKNWKPSLDGNNDEAINFYRQMSCSYSSEDDSNASQELNAGTLSDSKLAESKDKNGNKTGRRGAAIDPQSLYARKRRERINERLRILQNLVPNGTKVDISTMLEEAVHYVKFLQTQIKLLSSDDMWMYAPIAYNGVDIGLDRKLSENL